MTKHTTIHFEQVFSKVESLRDRIVTESNLNIYEFRIVINLITGLRPIAKR